MLKIYVLSILYTIGLFAFLASILFIIKNRMTKRTSQKNIILLFIFGIVVDLFLFDFSMYGKVTQEYQGANFNSKVTPYEFHPYRILNIISENVFNNFRPELYKKPTVFSSCTVENNFMDKNAAAKLYVILQDQKLKYFFYDELNALNIQDFLKFGFLHIQDWSLDERLFFLTIINATVDWFCSDKEFYAKYVDIEKIIRDLRDDIARSDFLFDQNNNDFSTKSRIERTINALFNITHASLYDYELKDYLIKNSRDNGNISKKRDFHNFIYSDISAMQYLMFLFEVDNRKEHIFVLLKDYYDLINLDKRYKEFMGYNHLLNNNLRRITGLTMPIIRYYSSASFSDRQHIQNALGNIAGEDVLYLEGDSANSTNFYSSGGENHFLYEILNYNPNTLSLKYQSGKKGYLYFSDSYDTYWNAYIDGRKTKIYKANIAFKAIKIPGGVHRVEFIYDPVYFRISLWIYYIAFCVCALYLLVTPFINAHKIG